MTDHEARAREMAREELLKALGGCDHRSTPDWPRACFTADPGERLVPWCDTCRAADRVAPILLTERDAAREEMAREIQRLQDVIADLNDEGSETYRGINEHRAQVIAENLTLRQQLQAARDAAVRETWGEIASMLREQADYLHAVPAWLRSRILECERRALLPPPDTTERG